MRSNAQASEFRLSSRAKRKGLNHCSAEVDAKAEILRATKNCSPQNDKEEN